MSPEQGNALSSRIFERIWPRLRLDVERPSAPGDRSFDGSPPRRRGFHGLWLSDA